MENPLVGVSACLLGEKVRYNGKSKENPYIVDILAKYVDLLPICPEVEAGLGVPRQPMHLFDKGNNLCLMTNEEKIDKTDALKKWCTLKIQELKNRTFCGFIFKAKSPSCGIQDVAIHTLRENKIGPGLFVQALSAHFPHTPFIDETGLRDKIQRENFIEQLFFMQRWFTLLQSNQNKEELLTFHQKHQFQLMTHSLKGVEQLSTLLKKDKIDEKQLFKEYEHLAPKILSETITKDTNCAVLYRLMENLTKDIVGEDSEGLLSLIHSYHAGHAPLLAPLTLLRHFIQRYGPHDLLDSTFLTPDSGELMLRYHL